jgi:tetratricopeptide (TPR) repeat protein
MLSSLSLFVVTTLAFQSSPPDGASGFRPSDAAKTAPVSNTLTLEMRADIYMARKMYREAAETYKRAPESAVIANKTGIAYHQMQQLGIARKYYERAIKLDPQYSEAVNNLGTIFYTEKSYRRAVTQYKKALRIKEDSPAIITNLGTAYFARKNYDLAPEMYQKALALDPEVFERRNTQGTLLQERSVEEKAKMHYTLAKAYAKSGKQDLAILYIRRALEEGFKDRDKFQKEPEFAVLRDNDEFKKLMAAEPKAL